MEKCFILYNVQIIQNHSKSFASKYCKSWPSIVFKQSLKKTVKSVLNIFSLVTMHVFYKSSLGCNKNTVWVPVHVKCRVSVCVDIIAFLYITAPGFDLNTSLLAHIRTRFIADPDCRYFSKRYKLPPINLCSAQVPLYFCHNINMALQSLVATCIATS